jgi:short-subunit dehydrogenase
MTRRPVRRKARARNTVSVPLSPPVAGPGHAWIARHARLATMNPLYRLADLWVARAAPSRPAPPPKGLMPAVVVTGGSEGIGFALAGRFRALGLAIILVARHEDRLAAAAAKLLRTDGPVVLTIPLDLTQADAAQHLIEKVTASGHYVEILINNAGIGLGGAFAEMPAADIDRLIALNVRTATGLMRAVLPDMLARGSGGVLTLASLGGFAPGPWQAAYYASKAYLLSLSEAVAAETAGSGVRIMALAPGPVETRFHQRMHADHALYRVLMPQLSAEAVAGAGYRGYRLGRRVVVAGLVNKLTALAMRLIPHILLIRVIGWLLTQPPEDLADRR